MCIKYPNIKVRIWQCHSFGTVRSIGSALRDHGVSDEECNRCRLELLNAERPDFLRTAMKWVTCDFIPIARMLHLRTDGTMKLIDFEDPESISAAFGEHKWNEMGLKLGCWNEIGLDLTSDTMFFRQAAGEENALPLNYIATMLSRSKREYFDELICGDVVIVCGTAKWCGPEYSDPIKYLPKRIEEIVANRLKEVEATVANQQPADLDTWAEVVRQDPDPQVVFTATKRAVAQRALGIKRLPLHLLGDRLAEVRLGSTYYGRILATGLPWKVRDRGTGIVMLLVPPGTFMMGARDGDNEAEENERPAHQVTISKPFYLAETLVTYEAWLRLMGAGTASALDSVGNVSWEKCQAFCAKFRFRLPTEAEWEYACRGGETTPPRDKMPNALGFYDMIGYDQWCEDYYSAHYFTDCGDHVIDPHGPELGKYRVRRGGLSPDQCRPSWRGCAEPKMHNPCWGFRVARSAPSP